ncbi:hypothetical protein [Sorangium sp. So ce233]|uniref:hypothetical protein n=1 Tax=Sorangium sp. So ce233 TaxID=3133290 RepID=UPI003F5EF48D
MGLGTVYTVEISLETKGDLPSSMGRLGGELDRVDRKAAGLGATLYGLGGRLSDGFTGAVETVGSLTTGLAKLGIAGAIGAATYGVTSLNKELETTTISLAAVLNKEGLTSSIEGGMQRAAAWVAQMKKDAKDLPGGFQELLGIVQSSAGAAFQAGLDDQGLQKLASQTMAAAKTLAVDAPQAGRDLARLLGGSAGMDNMLGSRLGFTAENFNTKTRAEQVKMISTELAKFQPAIALFGETFEANSDSLVDNLKAFGTTATKELFERVTGTLSEINAWFDANSGEVRHYAEAVGQVLVNMWDDGKRFVQEWGPSVLGFAERFYDKFIAVWRDAEPYVKSIAGTVKGFLDDPESLDHVGTAVQLYAGLKLFGLGKGALGALGIGGAAAGAAGGGGGGIMAGLAEKYLLGEGAAAARFGAMLRMPSWLIGAGESAGAAGQAIGAAGVGTAGLLAALGIGAVGAVGATGYEIFDAHRRAGTVDAKGGGAYGYSEGVQALVDDRVARGIELAARAQDVYEGTYRRGMSAYDPDEAARRRRDIEEQLASGNLSPAEYQSYVERLADLSEQNTRARDQVESFAQATMEASDAVAGLQSVISTLAASGDFEAIAKINQSVFDRQNAALMADQESERNNDFFRLNGAAMGIAALKALDEQDARAKSRAKKEAAAKGSGNVNIGRVEITVSSNQAPGQIAREVLAQTTDMRRLRKSSPSVQTFSSGR